MCTALTEGMQNLLPGKKEEPELTRSQRIKRDVDRSFGRIPEESVKPIKKRMTTPAEVPLGDGMADAARVAIMSRRERIRQAVDGAQ